MSEALLAAPVMPHRHRHRTSRRKLLDNVLMIVATLAAMFLVAAFSIELIEYQPVSDVTVVRSEGEQGSALTVSPRPVLEKRRSPFASGDGIEWDRPRLVAE
jgi:hypothetical protein